MTNERLRPVAIEVDILKTPRLDMIKELYSKTGSLCKWIECNSEMRLERRSEFGSPLALR
jgi:hypothetical protein